MAFEGVRVVDFSEEIAGPYCTKLLADAGADVVKVEPPNGDELRRWRASPDGDGALFRFLNTSKRSVVGAAEDPHVLTLVDAADVVIESFGPGVIDGLKVLERNPSAVLVSISPFGHDGPWASRAATEFTLQASCGSTGSRGTPDRPPVQAGGRLGEWIGGAYAAVAAVAALRTARRTGRGEHVDLSLLDCMSMTMNTYASVFGSFLKWPPVRGPARTIEIPSIEPTADGYVGFCTITGQQFQDFLVLIERADLIDDRDIATAMGRSRRMHEVLKIIHDWTTRHTTAAVIEQASLLRIPVAPIGNGATVTELEHFRERGTFVAHPGGEFVQPRVPYRLGDRPQPRFTPAPRLGEHTGEVRWEPRAAPVPTGAAAAAGTVPPLPLEGIRVVDFTAFWAGPAATHILAALGADVIKIESVQRPDGMRFATTSAPGTDRWWEWGPVYHGANAGKRGVTLDMSSPEGRRLAASLIERADAVVENFTPRVMESWGLGWDGVARINPSVVMVRMPAFGLAGPWRDRTGFAQTMEQVTGMAWVTGFADGPPLIPRGACDPLAGMHAVLALIAALEERERSGVGCLVEVTMVEAALNAAAEQVVHHGTHGAVLERAGNRALGAAPQGVYACAGSESWVAISIATDQQWAALQPALGHPVPDWAADPSLLTMDGRRAAHDRLDDGLAAWCAPRHGDELVEDLAARGVPAAVVAHPRDIVRNPQMQARRFFEAVTHPVVGTHELPGIPFRFASRGALPWLRSPAPTVGQHNDEVLGDLLGLSPDELARLRADHVIGEHPLGLGKPT